MAEPPVAEHVDNDVAAELLAELGGDLDHENRGLGIVSVHVEDRGLHHEGAVGRIGRGAAVLRRRGEADLVVDDEVQAAPGPVAPGPGDGEAFGHHALAGEGGVAVQ